MNNIPKKELVRCRMMAYFIDAAHSIIETEGIHAVTIRKVAERAGYNSATIYNYFGNLEHLIRYASIKYLKDYYLSIEEYIEKADNGKELFLLIWEKFCLHSYENPEIFRIIFFGNPEQSIKEIFEDYYRIYPSDFGQHTKETLPMLKADDIYDRNRVVVKMLANDGFINEDAVDEINEAIIIFYRGQLATILDRKKYVEVDLINETKKTVAFINKLITFYQPHHIE